MRWRVSFLASFLGWGAFALGIVGLVLLIPTLLLRLATFGLAVDWLGLMQLAAPFVMMGLGMVLIHCGRMMRAPRLRPGFCRGCGYDLRGSESDRCPECGLKK